MTTFIIAFCFNVQCKQALSIYYMQILRCKQLLHSNNKHTYVRHITIRLVTVLGGLKATLETREIVVTWTKIKIRGWGGVWNIEHQPGYTSSGSSRVPRGSMLPSSPVKTITKRWPLNVAAYISCFLPSSPCLKFLDPLLLCNSCQKYVGVWQLCEGWVDLNENSKGTFLSIQKTKCRKYITKV